MNNYIEYFGRLGVAFIIIILHNGVDQYSIISRVIALCLFCMWFLYPGYKLVTEDLFPNDDAKRSVDAK